MPYPFKYALVLGQGREATVIAFFTDKTHSDKCANEFNATLGVHGNLYSTMKIFPDSLEE
jgi:hypothetical protein